MQDEQSQSTFNTNLKGVDWDRFSKAPSQTSGLSELTKQLIESKDKQIEELKADKSKL